MSRRLPTGEQGMTLIEVLTTVIVVCVGVLATLATYTHFSAATNKARERSVLTSVAQRELEQLRPLSYQALALASPPPARATTEAPLEGSAAAEAIVTGGVVAPGGPGTGDFTYQGVHGRIYRYVTSYAETCANATVKVQGQLAALFGQTLSAIQASLPQICATAGQTRRVTVVVVPTANGDADGEGVRLSTIVGDTSPTAPAVQNLASLAVKSATGQSSLPAAQTVKTQAFALTDTRCSSTARAAPVDHATIDTSQAGFTCAASGPAPTLLTLTALTGSAADAVPDFSTDVTRAAQGGLAILRDTAAGSCSDTSSLVYTNAETDRRKHSVHTWATTTPAAAYETPTAGGRASLTLWSSTADAKEHSGRMCVTLRRASTGAVLGAADFQLATWPSSPTELTTAFDLDHVVLPAGERLLLTVRVPEDSGSDIRILYDHVKYASALTLTTVAGKEFR